jgi:probable HAF family extracellular repeat protein
MRARPSLLSRAGAAGLAALGVFTISCGDGTEPTAPMALARQPAGDPTVTSVVPDSSVVDVTLDITVNGTGFDQGSAVALERQGVPAGGITTNATTFVNSRRLIANITIAAEADTGSYDVAVTTTNGRKGVGIELFTVTYVLDELGIIGGTWSRAHAINERGEVVGDSCTDECLATAFYWSEADGQVDLGGLPGYSRSGAYAINNRGQVFGRVRCLISDPECGGVQKSALVRWERSGGSWTIALMEGCSVVLPLSEGSEKFLINNNDQCVGPNSNFEPVLRTLSGTSVVDEETLPAPFSGGRYWAYALSDAPMIGGSASTAPNEPELPVVWYRNATGAWAVLLPPLPGGDTRGRVRDIGEPDGTGRVRATGYTESGTSGANTVTHGVRWTLQSDGSGGWVVASTEILGTTRRGDRNAAWTRAVNTRGDVVGNFGSHFDSGDPVKWPAEGGNEPLPSLAGSGSGRAVAINDQGWIVGAVWDQRNRCDRAAIWRQQ